MKRKIVLCLFAILATFLMTNAYVVAPTKATYDWTRPITVTTTIQMSFGSLIVTGERRDVYKWEQDRYEHYIAFSLTATKGINGPIIGDLSTDLYPYSKLWSWPTPTYQILDHLPQYAWNGIMFVRAGYYDNFHGHSLSIKYDHPDNYQVYERNADGTPNVYKPYDIRGSDSHYARHIPYQDVQAIITQGLWQTFVGALLTFAGAVAGFGPPGWAVGGVIVLIAALLTMIGAGLAILASVILQTELGDGWMYVWNVGHWDFWWLHSVWFTASFGAWRDWAWHFFISNFCGSYIV